LTAILTNRFRDQLSGLEFNRAGLLNAAAKSEATGASHEFMLASA
jgi:hypothetical protein